ncbi:MAG: hypothetical protein IJW63_12280 [Lachnospiraceae bacterium]|nr:hypothetical protein [Lachnospiraceae bacterium]MBQ7360854.1 hypothetical protein [Lachnospiraceae bacterium]
MKFSKSFEITLESLIFVGLLAGGLLARLYSITDLSDTSLFNLASISENSAEFETSHGAFGVYVYLLRNLFYYVGNSWPSAVVLQIVMQLIGLGLLYFVIRKTTGIVAALISFSFAMFSPQMISAGVGLNPCVFYFLLCVLALYFLTESQLVIFENQKVKFYQFFVSFMIGLLCGVIIYLDIIGAFVLLLGLSFFWLVSNKQPYIQIKSREMYLILFAVGTLLGFVLLLGIDAFASDSGFIDTLLHWESIFTPAIGENWYAGIPSNYNLQMWIYLAILFGALLLGVLGFWECRYTNPQFGWGIVVFLLLLMQYNSSASMEMNRSYFCTLMLIAFASGGIQTFFTKVKTMSLEAEEVLVVEEEIKVEELKVEEEIKAVETTEPKKEIQFIPNPLPLPKKHVKKTMGYGMDVDKEQMCFDIEVSEDDDFDI